MFSDTIEPQRSITWALQFWPIIVCSFISAFFATMLCKKIALKLKITDQPDNLVKTHTKPVAYLGGIGILVGLTVGILTGIHIIDQWEILQPALTWLLGILAGSWIACFVGVIDDIFDIKPIHKILGQTLAALAIILVGIMPSLEYFDTIFHWRIPGYVEFAFGFSMVIIFVLGATNSLNLIDGLDGLCGGVTAIITVGLLLIALHLNTLGLSDVGDPVRIIVCLALLGGVCGFLPFNRHPAKIFMGDAGSILLGFVIATLMTLFAERHIRWWIASIVLFGLPILDTATAFIRRLINKRPLFVSDRGHIYDQMMDRGIPLKKTVAICYMLTSIYVLIGLFISQIRTKYGAVVCVLVFVISGLVIWKKGFLKMSSHRGVIQPPSSENDL
jgi:UDP-GlcNAc:undecaprenyl-phosphate/decaprenyl-phosphate GlcNAc-1-phosphate transferase